MKHLFVDIIFHFKIVGFVRILNFYSTCKSKKGGKDQESI